MIADDPFGSLGSSVPSERTAKAKRLSSKIAKGLSAEAAPEKPTRRGSEQKSNKGGASQAISQLEMQRKIEILMANPKLWAEFKEVLAKSGTKTSMGTQKALREFIEKNEEIAAEDAVQVEQTKRASGLGKSLMGAVNALSLDLGSEEADPNPPPAQKRQSSTQPSSSTGKSRVASAARSSFTNASNMGMNFLRRAGEVASSSISGLDEEAGQSVETNESTNASSLDSSSSALFNSSSQDFVGVLNDWFGEECREVMDEVPEENEEENEETEAEETESKEKK